VSRGTPDPETPELVDLINRLEKLLNESELSELEIEAGQTGLVLKKPSAFAEAGGSAGQALQSAASPPPIQQQAAPAEESGPVYKGHVVAAPLTGLFYSSPSPGAEPYVSEGGPVSNGQVIGLIEAMKLFNEIKSDVSGRVLRIHAETGALVKAKQALIEIEPT
jgi:acetyl-CoA carboxylase biotin carboxyl carrier protein